MPLAIELTTFTCPGRNPSRTYLSGRPLALSLGQYGVPSCHRRAEKKPVRWPEQSAGADRAERSSTLAVYGGCTCIAVDVNAASITPYPPTLILNHVDSAYSARRGLLLRRSYLLCICSSCDERVLPLHQLSTSYG